MKSTSAAPELTDPELIALARTGDQAAYGQLVSRHQNLVASLAYSICGDFARSQDIAQEAFVAAWRQLGGFGDPANFKAWLCGITRNLGNNSVRRQTRRAEQPSASFETTPESATDAPNPQEHAVTREESAIVWSALEQLPEAYREPLILFYREHHSIELVSAALDLSEDTVKQRLSRGRAMLRDQVESLVERSLGFTTPGVIFTATVLGALPVAATQIAAATVAGGAAKSGAAAKAAGAIPWLSALATPFLAIPFISLLGTAIESRIVGRYSRSPEERKFMQRLIWTTGLASTLSLVAILAVGWWQFRHDVQTFSSLTFTLILLGLLVIAVVLPSLMLLLNGRRFLDYARNAQPPDHAPRWMKRFAFAPRRAVIYRSRLTAFGLPLVDIRFGYSAEEPLVRGTATGWIAMGDIAHGVVLAVGGFAVGGIAVGGIALGALSTGYLAIGLVAIGGVAVGGLAKGILVAIGYVALGTVAIGWEAASGIVAFARHIASGGIAVADSTAYAATHGWEETNPLVRTFKPGTILAIALPAVLNALLALLGMNALARHRRDRAHDDRRSITPSFLGLLSLAVVCLALLGNLAVERTSRAIDSEREAVSHAKARHELGRTFARTGQPAKALAEYLWCLDDDLRRGRTINDRGAIYSDLEKLSRTYPPAKAELDERRDRAEAAVLAGHAGPEGINDVWEVVVLNNFLREAPRSRVLYDRLPPTHGLRPMLGRQLSIEH